MHTRSRAFIPTSVKSDIMRRIQCIPRAKDLLRFYNPAEFQPTVDQNGNHRKNTYYYVNSGDLRSSLLPARGKRQSCLVDMLRNSSSVKKVFLIIQPESVDTGQDYNELMAGVRMAGSLQHDMLEIHVCTLVVEETLKEISAFRESKDHHLVDNLRRDFHDALNSLRDAETRLQEILGHESEEHSNKLGIQPDKI